MKKTLLILAGVLLMMNVSAQSIPKGYVEGFLVTNANDTIQGYLKYKNKEEILDKVTVILEDETKKTYKAADIKSFDAEEDFVTQKISGEHVFMKVLALGYYSLFEYKLPAEQGGKYQLYYQKEGGKLQMISISGWKKQVESLVSDSPELVEGIKKKSYTLETLGALFEAYNAEKE